MPAINITEEQRLAAENFAADSSDALEFGILDENNVEYIPPVPDNRYGDLTSEQKDVAKTAFKQQFAPLSRYFLPIGSTFQNVNPVFTITSITEIASVSIESYIPRNVMIALNLSAYVDVGGLGAGFSVMVNGVPVLSEMKFYFNSALLHMSFSGTWVGLVPAGSSVITANLQRLSGTGNIVLNTDDSISLSVIG